MLRPRRSPRNPPESLVGRQGEQAQLASKPWTRASTSDARRRRVEEPAEDRASLDY
jgi:hypothetical protein